MIDMDTAVELVIGEIHRSGEAGYTFAEMESFLGKRGFSARGDTELWIPELNIVLWQGVSDEFTDLVNRLISSGRTRRVPVEVLVYLPYGRLPNLPVTYGDGEVRRIGKPHWFPMVFKAATDTARRRS